MAGSQLQLGAFFLTRSDGATRVLADGTSRGNPVPLEVTIKSWLQDGAVVLTQGYDNREMSVRVRFFGDNHAALNTLEASLFAELNKPNTLTWTPPTGPATVFDVVTSSLTFDDTDDGGDAQGDPWRTYVIRLICLPFGRSVSEVITPALAASGSTTTLVDDGSATTNWTGTINGAVGTVAVVSGMVGVTTTSLADDTVISLTRTASITTSATPYLVVDYKPTQGAYVMAHAVTDLRAYDNAGTELTRLSSYPVSSTVYRATFYVTTSSISALRLDLTIRANVGGGSEVGSQARTFHVDNINRTDIRPSIGTTRQQLRSLSLTGSARTPGSLSVQHASTSLGDALVYVWAPPDSGTSLYVPAMGQYRTSGGTLTSDSTMVSGNRYDVDNLASITYDVPMSALPAGSYLVLARTATVTTSFTRVFGLSFQTRVNSTAVDTAVTGSRSISGTTTYDVQVLARVNLPNTVVRDASAGTLRFVLTNNSGSTLHVTVDEVWLFNTTIGSLTWVQCGTAAAASGGPSKRLFLDAPTIARPRPVVLQGFASDGSDAYYAGVQAWGSPVFDPPLTNVFTVTTNTTDADVAFRSFPRWHTNAAS